MAFNKYQVIKGAVSYELANFVFNYFLLKRDAVSYMYQHNIHSQSPILGTWSDEQIPNTYSCYGDFVMDTYCGSGTSLVTANNLNRNWIGIDQSESATEITKSRLDNNYYEI